MKKLFTLLTLFLSICSGAWAIEQDTDGYYLIGTVQDWKDFAALVEMTPAANAKMTADVDLGDDQTMIGTASVTYQGSFDGQRHTLNIAYDVTSDYVAPFRYIGGATIQNIHVTGTISTNAMYAAGIAGNISSGSNYIRQAYSSVSITGHSNASGQIDWFGGIVGQTSGAGCVILIDDCLFDGHITGSSSNYSYCANMVGIMRNSAVAYINNCLSVGTFSNTKQVTSMYNWIYGSGNTTNSYFVSDAYAYTDHGTGTAGVQVTPEQLSDGTTATALQAGRDEEVWVQDPFTNQPMLKIFANVNPFAYTVSGDEVTITGFASGFDVPANYDLVIPDEIEGKPVVAIGASAFDSYKNYTRNMTLVTNVKGITIGKNVRTIGRRAFMENAANTISFADDSKLENIGEYAFYRYSYEYHGSVDEIVLPASLNTVGTHAFSEHMFKKVTLLGYIESLDTWSFALINNLKIFVPLQYLDNYSSIKLGYRAPSTYYQTSVFNSEYTVPASGIGTFSTGTAVTMPEGLRAYYCKNYDSTAGTIATKEITGSIPANTGVLLRGTAGETYTITASAETPDAISENALVAVTEETHVDQTEGEYTNFMMKGGKFIKIAASSNPDEKMPANRAYLQLPTASIANSLNIEIDWKEETGIRLTPNPSLLSEGNIYYTLDGRKLNGIPANGGVYINNGKKVIK